MPRIDQSLPVEFSDAIDLVVASARRSQDDLESLSAFKEGAQELLTALRDEKISAEGVRYVMDHPRPVSDWLGLEAGYLHSDVLEPIPRDWWLMAKLHFFVPRKLDDVTLIASRPAVMCRDFGGRGHVIQKIRMRIADVARLWPPLPISLAARDRMIEQVKEALIEWCRHQPRASKDMAYEEMKSQFPNLKMVVLDAAWRQVPSELKIDAGKRGRARH
jgi:hypothetical protein